MPRSFRLRLILVAIVWVATSMLVSGIVLTSVFYGEVTFMFELELSEHADELEAMLEPDERGHPVIRRQLSDPRFDVEGSGFYWQIVGHDGSISRSLSLGSRDLGLGKSAINGQSLELAAGPTGPMLLFQRAIVWPPTGTTVNIGLGADEFLRDEVVAKFRDRLIISLGLVAIGLIGAAFAQVTFGLRPLGRIRQALSAIRTGESQTLPIDLPAEVMPLVTDLNRLLDANRDVVRRARAEAGNLAHALKTPLAILIDEGQRMAAAGHPHQGQLIAQQCEKMLRHVDYHLVRSRASVARTTPLATAKVSPVIESVVAAMRRLHRDRNLTIQIQDSMVDARVPCDPDDLHEIVANLVDNAAKWARAHVIVRSDPGPGSWLRLRVEDDGPGMPKELREVVFEIGKRLDERAPGSGFGLAIVRDLVDLYGGRVWFDDARIGGVAACVDLPLAAPV
jgi:signal transduction histidine kinase